MHYLVTRARAYSLSLSVFLAIFRSHTIDNANGVSDDASVNIGLCEIVVILNTNQNVCLIAIAPVFVLGREFVGRQHDEGLSECVPGI